MSAGMPEQRFWRRVGAPPVEQRLASVERLSGWLEDASESTARSFAVTMMRLADALLPGLAGLEGVYDQDDDPGDPVPALVGDTLSTAAVAVVGAWPLAATFDLFESVDVAVDDDEPDPFSAAVDGWLDCVLSTSLGDNFDIARLEAVTTYMSALGTGVCQSAELAAWWATAEPEVLELCVIFNDKEEDRSSGRRLPKLSSYRWTVRYPIPATPDSLDEARHRAEDVLYRSITLAGRAVGPALAPDPKGAPGHEPVHRGARQDAAAGVTATSRTARPDASRRHQTARRGLHAAARPARRADLSDTAGNPHPPHPC